MAAVPPCVRRPTGWLLPAAGRPPGRKRAARPGGATLRSALGLLAAGILLVRLPYPYTFIIIMATAVAVRVWLLCLRLGLRSA